MVDLAKEAFTTNNFCLAADIFERTIQESGPTSELYLGLADSLAKDGQFWKAFDAYLRAYRYGKVTPEKLKHLVNGLVDNVKQDSFNMGKKEVIKPLFTCGLCRSLLVDPVSIPCGHTFCRKCLEKDKTKTCDSCGAVHYRLKICKIKSNIAMSNLMEKWFPKECEASKLREDGNALVDKRNYLFAIEKYSQAILIAPNDHLLLSNRSHAYASLDRFVDALADASKVVDLRPDWPKGYFRKGVSLYGLSKYEDSVVAFLQCLALDHKVTSAKDHLSKALDKILSVLPSDDPKAETLFQNRNPSVFRELLKRNFSRPLLLSKLHHKLSDLSQILKDTIDVASDFHGDFIPCVLDTNEDSSDSIVEKLKHHSIGAQAQKRCLSLPDCSSVDHMELKESTMPRTHSPVPPSVISRKRILNSGTSGPLSPTQSSPEKLWKPAEIDQRKALSTDNGFLEPQHINVEDLECSLCYRLFHEPVTTPCGHSFCRRCLDRCLDHTISCPICKGNLAEYLAERRQTVTDCIQGIIETYFNSEFKERCRINEEEMIELAKMGSDQQSNIPVFVCTLSYPTVACPLHIFEPRYRLMIRQCMESGTRQFGMCMHISDNDEEFSDYGCMLEVRDVQYFPDGRSIVDTIGGRRFKVVSRGKRDGYNTAKVEFISDRPLSQEDQLAVSELESEVYGMARDWLNKLSAFHQTRITQHYGNMPALDAAQVSPGNGPQWAWWAIAVLPLNQQVQMTFVAMTNYKERLNALKKVLVYLNRRNSR